MVKYKISTFGITREIIGSNVLELEVLQELSVGSLKNLLHAKYPELSRLRSLAVAVEARLASDATLIHSGQEIALIPPVSGG